jgi:probable addiction module antidote protein
VVAYLQAAMAEAGDDPEFVAIAIGNVARARGMMQLAKETGISREGLYKALAAGGNPSFSTILKVTKALGVKLVPARAA